MTCIQEISGLLPMSMYACHTKEERRTPYTCPPLLFCRAEREVEKRFVFCSGSEDRSMSGARATKAHPWSPSQQHMPGAEAATEHAWSSTQQAAPGVVLNRANWHPQRSSSTTVYSIQVATLLTLTQSFNHPYIVAERKGFL